VYRGNLRKMSSQLGDTVQYSLTLGEDTFLVNDWIGKPIKLAFQGEINCRICGRKTNKSYGQGFCFPHFQKAPENSPCIIRPELCEGHLGNGRDPEWEQTHHVKPHVVYLALTSGVKVGVTRHDQVPTRWIDQGAWKAVQIANVPYRRLAGEIEVALKDHMSDKTNWRKMLSNQMNTELDLAEEIEKAQSLLPAEYQEYIVPQSEITEITYPVEAYPEKVKSLKLDKIPEITGTLQGIRGQYLILDEGRVINLRSHTSYLIEWSAG
ncbi:MAG: DUF2797 domain-containing protein, partial [Bacteroidota bacterium]